MTKVTILGEAQGVEPKKKIEFVKKLMVSLDIEDAKIEEQDIPTDFDTILLLTKNYGSGYDLMYAYTDDNSVFCLYLGHFNDGIV